MEKPSPPTLLTDMRSVGPRRPAVVVGSILYLILLCSQATHKYEPAVTGADDVVITPAYSCTVSRDYFSPLVPAIAVGFITWAIWPRRPPTH